MEVQAPEQSDGPSRNEDDSHADTCVVGKNFLVLHQTKRTVTVEPFSPDLGTVEEVPIVSAVTAYECDRTGRVYLLVIHEALHMPQLQNSLLSPNQLRDFGVVVNTTPTVYDETSEFGITIPASDVFIPFSLEGTVAGFESRLPTHEELSDPLIKEIELTSDIEWDPMAPSFANKHPVRAAKRLAIRKAMVLKRRSDVCVQHRCVSTLLTTQRIGGPDFDDLILECLPVHGDKSGSGGTSAETPLTSDVDMETELDGSVGREVAAMRTDERASSITPEAVAKKWMIGTSKAAKTLRVTTQAGIKYITHPAARRFKTDMAHIRYNRIPGTFYADIMEFPMRSIDGQKTAHTIGNGHGYARMFPMDTKRQTIYALDDFVQNVGIPENLQMDNDPNMPGWSVWNERRRSYRINPLYSEPHSPWQLRAEVDVREIKRGIKRFSMRARSPLRLWNYLGPLVCKLRCFVASDHPNLQGRSNYELIHGQTPEIGPYIQHAWYEVIEFRDADGANKLACWLGPAENHGGGGVAWLLKANGKIVARSTFWALTATDRVDREEDIKKLLTSIDEKIGDGRTDEEVRAAVGDLFPDIQGMMDDDWDGDLPPAEPELRRDEADEYTPEEYDKYLNASVMLNRNGEVVRGTVTSRSKTHNGVPVGTANANPLLDTREYIVEYVDGSEETLTANLVAEAIYSQVNDEGHSELVLREIIDHRRDGRAITIENGFDRDKQGRRRPKRTTVGWSFLAEFKDGSTGWLKLKDMKDSYPLQTADYAQNNNLINEPAFAWWVPLVLRKRERYVKKIKTKKRWRRTHKYGVELPTTVEEALEIDRKTGTDFWTKALDKELRNVFQTFKFVDRKEVPPGYTQCQLMMVFDIKLDLTRKCRLCCRGDLLDSPKSETFASVVSRDSVRLFFLLAALNDMDVLSCDIQNAFTTAPARDKNFTVLNDELGPEHRGKTVILVRALYGQRTAGRVFRDFLASHFREMGWTSCRADPDVWLRPATRDGHKIYEYLICYTDDVVVACIDPKLFMDQLGKRITLKEGSVKPPTQYLGADVKRVTLPKSGREVWALESTSYTKKAYADVETELAKEGKQLMYAKTPLADGYRPEVDESRELSSRALNYYQGLIGVLRWICELGRVDILHSVSIMSRYLVGAREGHLEQVFHIFSYLKHHPRSALVFDDTELDFATSSFTEYQWQDIYPDAAETMPPNMPEPRGREVTMSCFCDADHAGCKATRRSHSGILIFVNRAPILFYSKRQSTVEASTFGSELIAMRLALEMIEGLRYKLRMMGVPISTSTSVFCDNNSVVLSMKPDASMKKKHCQVNYHRVREAIAAGTIKVAKEGTHSNLADVMTKSLSAKVLKDLIKYVLW